MIVLAVTNVAESAIPGWALAVFGVVFVVALVWFVMAMLGPPSNMDPDGG